MKIAKEAMWGSDQFIGVSEHLRDQWSVKLNNGHLSKLYNILYSSAYVWEHTNLHDIHLSLMFVCRKWYV